MDNSVLRQLAREREARHPRTQAAAQPRPSYQTRHRPAQPDRATLTLLQSHSAILMARSIGTTIIFISLLLFLVYREWRVIVAGSVVGALFARSGAEWLYSILPAMLKEGAPPTSEAQATASSTGLYSRQVIDSPAAAISSEHRVFLHALAFVCTYGRKNCLTGQMYDGELSFGKIFRLVGSKLAVGTVRC